LTLREDHGLQEEIFDGLTGLFGRVVPVGGAEGKEVWVVDVKRVIREMGKGMLLEENVSARRPDSREDLVVGGLLLIL
jgi:hypothetical protein